MRIPQAQSNNKVSSWKDFVNKNKDRVATPLQSKPSRPGIK
jgi:hypothetical protein